MKKLVRSRTGRHLQRYNLGCRQVVGCIPWRYRKNGSKSPGVCDIEFLLISSQKSPKWMFPKGGWESDETMEEAAIRETMEEAGVLGEVGVQLGMWRFKSRSQDCFHEGFMFAFEVKEELNDWPEKDVRKRLWLPANEAREKCVHQWMKDALDIFLCQFTELLQCMEHEHEQQPQEQQEQQQQPESSPPWIFDMFVTKKPVSTTTTKTTIVAQSGKDVANIIDCHVIELASSPRHRKKDDEQQKQIIKMPYLMDIFRAEGPMIGIIKQIGQLSQKREGKKITWLTVFDQILQN